MAHLPKAIQPEKVALNNQQPFFFKPAIQPKLTINQPGDIYEQEADAMADKVMQMPANSLGKSRGEVFFKPAEIPIQRKCEHCEDEETEIQRKEINGEKTPIDGHLESYVGGLTGSGQFLPNEVRNYYEPRFSYDFSNVKIHADGVAAKSAQSINALAYTTGNNIVFNEGQYAPGTDSGKKLLAHELTHVIQQNSTASIQAKPDIQREVDGRIDDPNFLLCLALCELGMPPGIWRVIMDEIMQAVSVEYGGSLGTRWFAQRSPAFRRWSTEFAAWSTFNKLKFALVFIAEGKIGFIPIRTAAAAALRTRLLERLVLLGIRQSAVVAASQIIRKVAIFLEVAYAAGCATYCGAIQVANALIDFGEGVSQVLSSLQEIGSGIGAAISEGISRVFLTAQATLDPSNWRFTDLPTRSRAHLNFIGLITGLSSSGDSFLRYVGTPLQAQGLGADIIRELSEDINATLQARGGFYQVVQFTPDFIARSAPLSLIQILHDYNIIQFIRNPEALAEERLHQSEVAE